MNGQAVTIDVRIDDPNPAEASALESIEAVAEEHVAVRVPVLQMVSQGIGQNGALLFVAQVALPPGTLACQTTAASRILDPNGNAASVMQGLNKAIAKAPPTVSILVRKDALSATLTSSEVPNGHQ